MLQKSGHFQIHVQDSEGPKTVNLRFCTWSLIRFTERAQISLQQMLEGLGSSLQYNHMLTLILSAAEWEYRKAPNDFPYTEDDVYEWIDALGGLNSDGFTNMMNTLIASVSGPALPKGVQAVQSDDGPNSQ
jgi:hypothetical protein